MDTSKLFENAIAWLKEHYPQFQFFVERDVVWTIQKYLISQIKELNLPYRVFNDYPILPVPGARSICADLVFLNLSDEVEVAVEFKYKPSHKRSNIDIWPTKLKPSVVFWGDEGVSKDIKRVQNFVELGKTKVAYAVFIDEDSHFIAKSPHPGSQWIQWYTTDVASHRTALLWSRVPSK